MNKGFKKLSKIKNLLIYVLSFSASACGILLNFILARFLGANNYGRLQYFVALATTISQFLILGMNSFLIREAKNEKQNGKVFNKCASLYFAIILFFLPIVYFLLKNVFLVSYHEYFLIAVTIMAVLMGMNSLITSYFQGNGKFHLTILFENLIPKLVLLSISIVFLLAGFKKQLEDNYLLFYIILYSSVAIPFCIALFKKINFKFERSEIKSIIFFFGVTVTYSLGNNLTKVIQGGLYKNDIALGVISVSISIVSLVKVFTAVLDNMIKPLFAKKQRDNDINGLIETYRFDTRVNSYVSIPLYLFFIIHPDRFLAVFGQSYTIYPFILVFISIANAIADLTGPNGTMLAMTGNEKWELFNGLLYFSVYILSVFILSFDKVYGLCLALLIGQIAVNVAKYIETWVIYKTTPLNLKSILSILLIITVNFVLIFAMRFVKLSLWYWMPIGIVCGMLCVVLNSFVISLYRIKDIKQLISLKV